MPFLSDGFHTIDKAAYHADPCANASLSASAAKVIADESPAHAWYLHPRGGGGQRDSTKAMDGGTLLDSLLLGADTEIVSLPARMPDAKGKEVDTGDAYHLASAKAWRDEQIAAGRLPVKRFELEQAKEAAEAIKLALIEMGIVFDGINQQTMIWTEMSSHGPISCRGRLDHLRGTLENPLEILDLKRTDSNPKELRRSMYKWGHHIQDAAYRRGIGRLVPEVAGRIDMTFIYVNPVRPYRDNITIAAPDASGRALGTFEWERAIEAWGAGVYKGQWPGWSAGKILIEPMSYQMQAMEAALEGGSQGVTF